MIAQSREPTSARVIDDVAEAQVLHPHLCPQALRTALLINKPSFVMPLENSGA
jgi:hypothetical protein